MSTNEMRRRLERLEGAKGGKPLVVRTFLMQGPVGCDAGAFLRSQGHDLDTPDLCIIQRVVGVEHGKPADLPLADLTPMIEQA